MLAGALFVVSDVLDLANAPEAGETDALLAVQSGLTLLAGLLLLFGLIGLYARRSEELGLLGLFGFVTAFSGTVMALGGFWSDAILTSSLSEALSKEASTLLEATPPRALAAGFTLSYGFITVGWFAFGLAALRDGFYPRVAALFLMVGAALTWLPLPLTGVPFSLAVIWLGRYLSSKPGPLDQTVGPASLTSDETSSSNFLKFSAKRPARSLACLS